MKARHNGPYGPGKEGEMLPPHKPPQSDDPISIGALTRFSKRATSIWVKLKKLRGKVVEGRVRPGWKTATNGGLLGRRDALK